MSNALQILERRETPSGGVVYKTMDEAGVVRQLRTSPETVRSVAEGAIRYATALSRLAAKSVEMEEDDGS